MKYLGNCTQLDAKTVNKLTGRDREKCIGYITPHAHPIVFKAYSKMLLDFLGDYADQLVLKDIRNGYSRLYVNYLHDENRKILVWVESGIEYFFDITEGGGKE